VHRDSIAADVGLAIAIASLPLVPPPHLPYRSSGVQSAANKRLERLERQAPEPAADMETRYTRRGVARGEVGRGGISKKEKEKREILSSFLSRPCSLRKFQRHFRGSRYSELNPKSNSSGSLSLSLLLCACVYIYISLPPDPKRKDSEYFCFFFPSL